MSAPPILDERQDAKPAIGWKARDYLRAIVPLTPYPTFELSDQADC